VAGSELCFRSLAFRDLFSRDINRYNFATQVLHRVPVSNPDAIYIGAIRSLSVYLDTGHRFARIQNCLHNLLYLLGDSWDGLAHRPPDVVRDRDAANPVKCSLIIT